LISRVIKLQAIDQDLGFFSEISGELMHLLLLILYMKTTLKLEEIGKLLVAYLLTPKLGFSFWVFWVWLLAPDVSMLGYLAGNRVGAFVYNLFHHQGSALGIGLIGLYLNNSDIQFAGLLLFGHSAMDRALGYGLKYERGFKFTHLGELKGGK
jgi:hypothetical protein